MTFSPEVRQPWATLVELLRQRAADQPNAQGYTFLGDGDDESTQSITYAELDAQARALAVHLAALDAAGKRVLLLYRPGLDYIVAFFGCLYAGAVAVPAYPPSLKRPTPRLQAILEDSRAGIVLTTTKFTPSFVHMPDLAALPCLTTDTLGLDCGDAWSPPAAGASLAFLQYTSGSTSTPKGVMLTHANLLHNLGIIQAGFGHSAASRGVIWLPPYHDMGLIGGILQPLLAGFPVTLMAPVSFLQQPFRWLETISATRATTSGGPNFAYDLCVRKITPEQRATLDLSSWEVAFNGAEPIRAETLDRFVETFAPCGFRREAFYPCYGLAEATLMVSGVGKQAAPLIQVFDAAELEQHRVAPAAAAEGRSLVASGTPLAGQEVAIVRPHDLARCGDNEVGEIWVRGGSVAQGYWARPEQSRQSFQAQLAGDEPGAYLRTGDLGFVYQGQLFVTGRLKDLIIIRGRNYYPQDIELTAERSHRALRENGAAAFALEHGGEERLVIVQEVNRVDRKVDPAEAIAAIRQAVAQEHEVQVHAIALIQEGGLPRTSSGKVQRHACKAAFLAGDLKTLGSSVAAEPADTAPADSLRERLLAAADEHVRHSLLIDYINQKLARMLSVPVAHISAAPALDRLGLDSLMAVELKHSIEEELGAVIPMTLFLEEPALSDIIAAVLAQLNAAAVSEPPLHISGQAPGSAPAAQGQRSLWFLHELAPNSAAYNVSTAFQAHGPLDAAALHAAFQALVDRHPALRTTFELAGDGLTQIIEPQRTVAFQVIEAAGWNRNTTDRRLRDLALAPFDLERGPLFRVHVLRRRAEEHIVMICVHHSVVDFWSLVIMIQELRTLYGAAVSGSAPELAPLKATFADYAAWQADLLRSPAGEQAWRYWQRQLAGELPRLRLPTDTPRPLVQTHRGSTYRFKLSADQTRRLKDVARAEGVTLYMALAALLKVLLYRYSGETDVIIGSPTAGRDRAHLRDIVGYFVNPIALRTSLRGNPRFSDLLQRVRQTALAAFKHQSYPFNMLVERLQPQRDLSTSPIFQTMFVLERPAHQGGADLTSFVFNAPGATIPMDGLTLETYPFEQHVTQFDLSLRMVETEDGLMGAWEYNLDLFNKATIARLSGHFENLLAAMLRDPAGRIADLTMLSRAELRRLLQDTQPPQIDFHSTTCIHQHVETRAAARPNALAISFQDQRLTYGELNRRANQLAHYLLQLGVGPELRVGIYMERSLDLMVNLLAVLKAGGAYVPLDLAHPAERISLMVGDAGATVILTQTQLADRLDGLEARAICVDGIAAELARMPVRNPSSRTRLDHLAYIIYTSGSTGVPKGVAVEHRSLLNLIDWHIRAFEVGPQDRASLVAGFAFDASVWEVWPYLVMGAAIVIADDTTRTSAGLLRDWLISEQITIAFLPTPLTEHVLYMDWPEDVALHTLLTGGDKLQHYPPSLPFQVVNNYGPTENTVVTTSGVIPCNWQSVQPPPIGRPIVNTQAYILDPYGTPVPAGVPGELYVGGANLARGYLNLPALTAERFVPNPFGAPGARMYRTGDLVRATASGNLQFLGRIDQQVKIRGLRIELGEIETLLSHHPAICEVLVLVDDAGATQRLIAFFVPQDAYVPSAAELRGHLKNRLPEYMIPSAYIQQDALPLTPNGKIDQRALRALIPAHAAGADTVVAPRTATERQIAGIWMELFGLTEVSVEASFFELGGHSLLATQLISRLNDQFQVRLPLAAIFEQPTVAHLAGQIDRSRRGAPQPAVIPLAPRTQPLPMSFAQQRLWLIDQLEEDAAAYIIPAAVRLRGALDADLLQHALNALVDRHETLRTTFEGGDRHCQIIHPALPLELIRRDLRDVPAHERAAASAAILQEEGRRPFDLRTGPLLRATLVCQSDTEHTLLLAIHHIICDGWSIGVLIEELRAIYAAALDGRAAALPPLAIQYADFSRWQRDQLEGAGLAPALSYWRRRLAGSPALMALPTDAPRPAVQQFRGGRVAVPALAGLTAKLHALGQAQDATLFMVLLAAIQTLLHRYSGQTDILVGAPIAGRTRTEVEGLIGCFVNPLVLRASLADDPSFTALLRQVRQTTLEAYEHQDLPFEQLVEAIQPQRSLSHTPLFQVLFVFQNTPLRALELPGLELEVLDWHNGTAKFDLTFNLEEGPQGVQGWVEYNADLFAQATVERMADHLRLLLAALVAAPDQPISRATFLPDEERQRLLGEWNATRRPFERRRRIHDAIEATARAMPDATALIDGGREFSYGGLERRANQLACHLQSLGVGPEQRVGVCLERSAEMVVAMLAILKAGGAYVPLDPAYPQERLNLMLEDAQARFTLTQPRLQERVAGPGGTLIDVDLNAWAFDGYAPEPPAAAVDSANLAYLIYTSGSTGRPKGVAITHRNAVALLTWAGDLFTREELSGVLAATSICFDLSVYELFLPLSVGGTVILAENALALADLPAAGQVTLINTVPSAIAELARSRSIPVGVRTINLAGEPLPGALVRELYAETQIRHVYNLYGPSEDTTYSTFARVAPDSQREPAIGRPIANTRAYVLDRAGNPAPIGVPGELYLSGEGVARGYLNQPALTAEKFVPDPWSAEPGGRLYRTGDLVRWRADGELEFLGRLDHQVKLRGFRIELGEINAVLRRHPLVSEAVTLVRQDGAGAIQQLVGYVVCADPAPTAQDLRRWVGASLPEYMVPATVMFLDQLPLTPNGKLDRGALPAPEAAAIGESEYCAPRTPAEQLTAQIVGEVLGLERVSVDANFFELGGHSLLATQVVGRLRAAFQVELPLRALFEAPTVSELAAIIGAQHVRADEAPIAPVDRAAPLPLSFAQERLWFLQQLEPQSTAYLIPMGVRLSGALDVTALRASLHALVVRHESLRTTFRLAGDQPAQVIHQHLAAPLECHDLGGLAADEQAAAVQDQARQLLAQPFDLCAGPLLRMALLRLAPAEHVLLLTMHHIISDAWSMSVFIQETVAMYAALVAGEPPRLAELPVQYADVAHWQRQWLGGPQGSAVFERQRGYWQRQLAKPLPALDLPTDRPRPAVQTSRGATLPVEFDADLSAALQRLSHEAGATLFMTLLAAFNVLLARWSGQDDLCVGSPIANRTRAATEGLIGFFVNTLVLRTNLAGNLSFRELLGRVREVTLGAYDHQDLPFEKLVEIIQPQRDLSRHPLFQVMFVLHNTPAPRWTLPELSFERLEIASQSAQFDLTLSLEDTQSGLRGGIEYNTDLFDAATVERIAGCFRVLLAAIAAAPDTPIGQFPLLEEGERQRILAGWSRPAGLADAAVLHQLVEAQAASTPAAIAVADEQRELSYAQLNRRANRLATRLRALGVGPETLVGVCMERSTDLIVGLLAILKAGGAYVPLDPAYPAERLLFIIGDTGMPIMLTQRQLAERLPSHDQPLEIVCVDDDAAADDPADERNLESGVTAGNPAYIIYTSGSTGQPKGVMISHGAVSQRLSWMREAYAVTAADRMLQKTPLNFDVSVWEIFTPLLAGAQLVMARPGGHQDSGYLVQVIRERQITLVDFVPAMLDLFLEEPEVAQCRSLRQVTCGGEALPVRLQERFFALLDAELHNIYGPTETTIDATMHTCRRGDSPVRTPIGHAIAGAEAYVLDPWLQPAPAGVIGELYIGGPGLARGYLNRPELTAAAFIPHPFSPGARLYRTGDLARRLPDGAIDFIGRRDSQVKLRGLRIELGEIEAALRTHPGVSQAVAAVRQAGATPAAVLAAYVVPAAATQLDAQQLRAFLKARLPGYMVPTSLLLLDELPLLPNGKLDLAALPALEHRRDAAGPAFIAPRSPSEIQLAAIWGELLGLEQIGIHDNFFDLGGHSLLSTQAITRMRRAFSVELQLRAFFEQPTIAELAALIDRQQQAQSASQTARPQAIPRINRTVRRAVTQLEQLSEHEVQMLLQANQSATKGTEE